MSQTFTPTTDFFSSHKLGEVYKVTLDFLRAKLGDPTDEDIDGKVAAEWCGHFKAADGTRLVAKVWDWKGSLIYRSTASAWVSNPDYLYEWITYLKAPILIKPVQRIA